MPDERQRKRSAFIGRGGPSISPPRPVQHSQQQPAPIPQQASPYREERARQAVQQQMAPVRRKRLTADSGFAPAQNTPVMDDQEIEDFISEAERREPGSMVRGNENTASMMVGGPGYKEPKPGV
ncbi:MAG TPA: hypothetical protein VMW38_11730 [Terriglobia bacterium]|nr:hypothetical protein [Terriglobia bacterium]